MTQPSVVVLDYGSGNLRSAVRAVERAGAEVTLTGEALMGIFIAIPIVLAGRSDVLALPASLHFGGWLGVVMLAGLAWLMYRMATRQQLKP